MQRLICIMKAHLLKYIEKSPPKTEIFQVKKLLFSYFCSKHRVGEAVLHVTNTKNLCFRAEIIKIMYIPVNPSFIIKKVGFKGVKLYRHVFVIVCMVANYQLGVFRLKWVKGKTFFHFFSVKSKSSREWKQTLSAQCEWYSDL